MKRLFSIFILIFSMTGFLAAQWIINEEFENLDQWKPLIFPKIDSHSDYRAINSDGMTLLESLSSSSASGLLFRNEFDVYETPVLTWRWRVDELIPGGNGLERAGDDYALRIYVIFEYDSTAASGFTKLQYNLAKALYGEYPPHSGLNYVWANGDWGKKVIANPFTHRALMVAVETGERNLGIWREYTVNILEDYRKYFGEDPPAAASLALMTDSDNTRSSGGGYIDFIRIGR